MKKSFNRTGVKYGLVALVTALVSLPTGAAMAGHNFLDVPTSNIFHADIEWMLTNGITAGCGNGNYCPSDNVTREQMAAFIRRLSTKKVVNAATAESAVDSDTLDGLDSTVLMPLVASVNFSTTEGDIPGPQFATATLVAPVAGIIVVTVSGDSWGGGRISCSVVVNGTPLTKGNADHAQHGEGDCTAHGALEVAAGSHQIDLDTTGVEGYSGQMTAIWYPRGTAEGNPEGL